MKNDFKVGEFVKYIFDNDIYKITELKMNGLVIADAIFTDIRCVCLYFEHIEHISNEDAIMYKLMS